jgi:hypothetical protein
MDLTPNAFAGDDGSADQHLRNAVAEFQRNRSASSFIAVRDALISARLILPLVERDNAELGVDEKSDSCEDSATHISGVEFRTSDGKRALLAFSGIDRLHEWNTQARPQPQLAIDVARTVLRGDLDAIVLDLGSTQPLIIEGPMLAQVSLGHEREQHTLELLEQLTAKVFGLPEIFFADCEITDKQATIRIELVADANAQLAGAKIGDLIKSSNIGLVLSVPLAVEQKTN